MRRKPLFWCLAGLLCVGVALYLWRPAHLPPTRPTDARVATPSSAPAAIAASSFKTVTNTTAKRVAATPLDPKKLFPYRLSNTEEAYDKLVRNDRGILLMNASLDTGKPLNLSIPDRLRAPANHGSYIVQARGALDDSFRAALSAAGATIISYIPNNAYLVRVSEAGAQQLSSVAQSVLPYEPYYKLEPSLLKMAIETPDAVPSGGGLNVTLFPDAGDAGLAALQQLGAQVVAQDRTPFGPVVRVIAASGTLAAVASLPSVQGISTWSPKHVSNDLMRPALGVSADSTNLANYLGLTGTNINLSVNDTGVDMLHPDLAGGVFHITSDSAALLNARDPDGHGTHVIGTILGSGAASLNTSVYPKGVPAQGSVSNASFRGMAPGANAFVMSYDNPDSYLQSNAVDSLPRTRISNNSWNYGNGGYDIFAASYDAAVRDADPFTTGSQPLLFVFSAGNQGGGNDDGTGGNADSILSPATAKNVITVGAVEQPRFVELVTTMITNYTTNIDGHMTNVMATNSITNDTYYAETDSSTEVASFSSRGNVGLFTEGTAGRFKPDLVAPGTFVVSDRSGKWNTASYYNPTNYSYVHFPGIAIGTNALYPLPPILIPPNAVEIGIYVTTNLHSPTNLPTVPIYGVLDTFVTTGDYIGTNTVLTPTNNGVNPLILNPDSSIHFGLQNTNNLQTLNLDATVVVLTTNDTTDLLVLSNLNQQIAPYYRYESGTSMAAAGVSGMLACMQEYFETRLRLTNSPAMMKALLINGARTVGQNYDFGTSDGINSEGWGQPSLPNSTPGAFTNADQGNLASLPFLMFDQSPTNSLATGQSLTWQFTLSPDAQNQDLHITLVWTDPPGNPNAGTKLVNDLDLIVSDGEGDVYYGNDIPVGSLYNELGNTNAPITDSVNNVENVYIQAPQSSGTYTVTVLGRRVNVNAVTASTNGIVQDFALVISSGDAGSGVTNPITQIGAASTNASAVVAGTPTVTNLFIVTNGFPLFNQRVGANSQFAVNTATTYATNGTLAQWNFYIYTNIPTVSSNDPNPNNYTNVAIATIVPPNLGVPRLGAYNEVDPSSTNATRDAGADIDLYVSQDPTLTNLNPAAIAGAWSSGWVSASRSGTEDVLITNSAPGQVYYIGVKSEDQQAAQFLLFAESTDKSFNNMNSNGDILVTMLPAPPPFPLMIPGGSAPNPQHALILGFTTSTANIRNVIVTNTVTFPDFGDLIGTLSLHSDTGDKTDVLNNHTFFTNANDATETFVYDDSGQTPGARKSDGPGSTENFTGAKAGGVWMFTMVNDSSTSDTGYIQDFQVLVQPQIQTNRYTETIPPMSWFYDYVDVPADATNLSIFVSQNTLPLELYIKEGSYPSFNDYDAFKVVSVNDIYPLSVNKFTSPPLNAGRYFYGIYNPNTTSQTVNIYVEVDDSISPVATYNFLSRGNEPIPDDAVMDSTNHVGNESTVISAEVGVRIVHPRESDLVLTLVSPSGTRVLLAENRGGLDTNGFGSGFNTILVAPQTTNGMLTANTNIINLNTNYGTLVISYDFFTIPDDLRVYYQGQQIFDTGLISGSGTASVNFGPGSATSLSIVMNQPGSNPVTTNQSADAWQYTTSVITQTATYATFSEDTNKATLPIKFAVPPFGNASSYIPPTVVFSNGFEGVTAKTYAAPSTLADAYGGWKVLDTNLVNVVTVTALANSGSNVLALHSGSISHVLPTVAGQTYTLSFASHGRPVLQPVGWWKAENSTIDSTGNGNTGTLYNGVTYGMGEVGKAFNMSPGQHVHVPNSASLQFSNAMTAEAWIYPTAMSQNAIMVKYDSQLLVQGVFSFSLSSPGIGYLLINRGAAGQSASTPQNSIPLNQWSYFAATYDRTAIRVYVNGVLMNSVPYFTAISANTDDLGIGATLGGSPDSQSTAPFSGLIDEATLYTNALSIVQVQDIYAAGSAGKCPEGGCSVSATAIVGNSTNTFTSGDAWSTNYITFTATSNNMMLTITPATNSSGFEDGMLLDSFTLLRNAALNPTNYYLPEEPLTKLTGESSLGDWKLEVLDNRAGPATSATNAPSLVNWQLSLVLADSAPAAATLTHHIPQTNTVAPNTIVYFKVNVPPWAAFATNLLDVPAGTLNLLFNQTIEPTGVSSGDYDLLPLETGFGTTTLNASTTPPLMPGRTYYLGLQNPSSTAPANFTIEVDFNITSLTNDIPVTSTIAAGNVPRYFQFDVDTNNEVAAEFQILNPGGNVALVVSYGPPLPDLGNFAYFSDAPGASPQNIIVVTNSTPVPLAPGRWYLGVFNNDVTTATYTIKATETGPPTIIYLTNGVPFDYTARPGPPFTNFFGFIVGSGTPAALFELYNLSGNADLVMDFSRYPYFAPFDAQSTNPGTNEEQIVVRTNGLATVITNNLGGTFLLGVPNETSSLVSYTIRASLPTNGFLMSHKPFDVGITFPVSAGDNPVLSWPGVEGNCYEIQYSEDLVTWTTIQTVTAQGPNIMFSDPTPQAQLPPYRFYRVLQVQCLP